MKLLNSKSRSKETLRKVIQENTEFNERGCQIWKNGFNVFGQPALRIRGAIFLAAKITWWLTHGYKPKWTHMVCKCANPNCVNPEHYKDYTPHKEKLTALFKDSQYTSPYFTPEEKKEIHDRHLKGLSLSDLATELQCSRVTIHRAIHDHKKSIQNQGS